MFVLEGDSKESIFLPRVFHQVKMLDPKLRWFGVSTLAPLFHVNSTAYLYSLTKHLQCYNVNHTLH